MVSRTPAQALIDEFRLLASEIDPPGSRLDPGLVDRLRVLVASPGISSTMTGGLAEVLADLSLHPSPAMRDYAQRLLFAGAVETLADTFEPAKADFYDELFAAVVERCRRHPSGGAVNALLSRFGIDDDEALLRRRRRLSARRRLPIEARRRIRQVLVASRVTIGADVAVTSVVLQKIERMFPHATCVVFGAEAAEPLLAPVAKAALFADCRYERRGDLLRRLQTWVDLVGAVDERLKGFAPDECLFVDPDSRLTQLGLLPVVDAASPACFFDSRSDRQPGAGTLGELTARWLEDVLGGDAGEDALYPRVATAPADQAFADAVVRSMRAACARVTTVNLGVGGNARKHLSDRFDLDLVRALLADGGGVVLDKGVGDEPARVDRIVAALRAEGVSVADVHDDAIRRVSLRQPSQVLTYQGGLPQFAALIAAGDLYVGYDSAFQHVAAALAVPVIDVFVDAPNDLFCDRWRPHSRAPVRVVRASAHDDPREALGRILSAAGSLRAQAISTPITVVPTER